MAASTMTSKDALLTALAGLRAYEAGMYHEVLAQAAEDPGLTYAGALAVCAKLKEEIERLGGSPESVLGAIYDRAVAPATL